MNKVVLITGGTRGIGKACAIEFAKNNYNIVLNYVLNNETAEETKKYLIENFDVDVMLYKCDITNENETDKMIDIILNKYNRIDCLVNNAGIAIDTLVDDKNINDFKKILEVNLIAPFILSRKVGKCMYDNKEGVIINISSTNGMDTYYEYSMDYDASKAALINLTHNLSKFFAPYVRVNSVAPGWVNTEMNNELDIEFKKQECKKIYQNRFANPSEVASVVYFLASDKASYINNEVIRVDGGCDHQ